MTKRTSASWERRIEVMRLLADVAALKGDPPAQHQHLIDGLNAILHTRTGWFYVLDDFLPGKVPTMRHQVLATDPDPEFLRATSGLGVHLPMEAEPFADHALHDPSRQQLWTRDQVFSHPEAERRYKASTDLYDAGKVRDGMVALYREGDDGGRIVGVALHRMHEEPPLRPADHALLAFAVREMRDLVRRGHLTLAEAAPAPLPPRLQQVLERMLRGAGIKEIARELGLSVWTVREHVQRLYRHFRVSGREQLMAKFVSR